MYEELVERDSLNNMRLCLETLFSSVFVCV